MTTDLDHLLWRLEHNETAKHLCDLAAHAIKGLRAENNRLRVAFKLNVGQWPPPAPAPVADPEEVLLK